MTRSAFTLLEVTIALLIFGIVVAAVTESLVNGTAMAKQIDQHATSREEGQRIVDDLSDRLRMADWNYIWKAETATLQSWSFRISTSLSLDESSGTPVGMPIYGQTSILKYDRSTGEISFETDLGSGTFSTETLATGLATFHVYPTLSNTLDGNRMTLRLLTGAYDEETPLTDLELQAVDQYLTGQKTLDVLPASAQKYLARHLFEREVYLRSKRFTEKAEEAINDGSGADTGDTDSTDTSEDNTGFEPPEDFSETDSPTLVWSGNQSDVSGEIYATVKADSVPDYKLDVKSITVEINGENTSGLSYNIKGNGEVEIKGEATGAIFITVTAESTNNTTKKTTFVRETFQI